MVPRHLRGQRVKKASRQYIQIRGIFSVPYSHRAKGPSSQKITPPKKLSRSTVAAIAMGELVAAGMEV